MSVTVFDLDDLCDEHDPYDALVALKEKHPGLRVTMFAIPYRCSDELLARYRALDWVELGVHGYHHSTMECAAWGYEEARAKLAEIEEWWPGPKLFKAPGWVANQEVYRALKDDGWSVADNALQCTNWCEVPMYRYVYNLPGDYLAVHGHTWETCGNGPSQYGAMLDGNKKFAFVSSALSEYEKFDAVQETRNSWSHNTPYGDRAVSHMLKFVMTERPNGMVADFGGNDGTAAKAAIDAGYDACVVDGSPSRISYAHSELGIEAHLANLEILPFDDNTFDWGFCSHTAEHIENIRAAVSEMIRVCKSGIWWVVPIQDEYGFEIDEAHHQLFTKDEWLEVLGAEEVSFDGEELICVTRK